MSQNTPLVSVVLPVFNGEKFLLEAMSSILSQTYENFELLVVDDGSTDSSPEICASIGDSRVRLLRFESNRGLVSALNHGIDHSNGKFIARMDQDDMSLPERFAVQVQALENDPKLGVVGSWVSLIGGRRNHQWREYALPEKHEDIMATLFVRNCIAHPTVLLRKSLVAEDQFKYDTRDTGCEDYGLWTRLIRTTRFKNIPRTLLRYRLHGDSVSSNMRGKQLRREALRRILKAYWYSALPDGSANCLEQFIDTSYNCCLL